MFTEQEMLAPLVLAEVRERLASEKIHAELRIEADALKVHAKGRPEIVVDLPISTTSSWWPTKLQRGSFPT